VEEAKAWVGLWSQGKEKYIKTTSSQKGTHLRIVQLYVYTLLDLLHGKASYKN